MIRVMFTNPSISYVDVLTYWLVSEYGKVVDQPVDLVVMTFSDEQSAISKLEGVDYVFGPLSWNDQKKFFSVPEAPPANNIEILSTVYEHLERKLESLGVRGHVFSTDTFHMKILGLMQPHVQRPFDTRTELFLFEQLQSYFDDPARMGSGDYRDRFLSMFAAVEIIMQHYMRLQY